MLNKTCLHFISVYNFCKFTMNILLKYKKCYFVRKKLKNRLLDIHTPHHERIFGADQTLYKDNQSLQNFI